MAMTKQELQAAIASLDAAIVAGVRSATIGGQTLTYNTSASLMEARDKYQGQLNARFGLRRSAYSYPVYGGRGYDR